MVLVIVGVIGRLVGLVASDSCNSIFVNRFSESLRFVIVVHLSGDVGRKVMMEGEEEEEVVDSKRDEDEKKEREKREGEIEEGM